MFTPLSGGLGSCGIKNRMEKEEYIKLQNRILTLHGEYREKLSNKDFKNLMEFTRLNILFEIESLKNNLIIDLKHKNY